MTNRNKDKATANKLKFMLIYIIAVYVPFFIVLIIKYDVSKISLSRIGWVLGGFGYLFAYGLLTVPFLMYQMIFYIRRCNNKYKHFFTVCAIGGGLFLTAAVASPYRLTDSELILSLHRTFGGIGAGFIAAAITFMVTDYCLKQNIHRRAASVGYFFLSLFLIVQVCIIRTVALFQAGASLCFLCVLYLLNRQFSKSKNQAVNQEQEECIFNNNLDSIETERISTSA